MPPFAPCKFQSLPGDVLWNIVHFALAVGYGLHQSTAACLSRTNKWFRDQLGAAAAQWHGVLTLDGVPREELDQKMPAAGAVERVRVAVVSRRQGGLQQVLAKLPSCTALTRVDIETDLFCFDGAWLAGFSSLQNLASVQLLLHTAPAALAAAFTSLASCSQLQSLTFVAYCGMDMGTAELLGNWHAAITQLSQLQQLTLCGPRKMLPPAIVESLTVLRNLRSLTFSTDGQGTMDPALVAAFMRLTILTQMTALHLVHGGPWDPGSIKAHYLHYGPSSLLPCLGAFTQLQDLSVMATVADIHQLAPLTGLQRLGLIIALAEKPVESAQVDNLLQQPLSALSVLVKLQTLWLESAFFKKPQPAAFPEEISTWGLKELPSALAKQLTSLRTVGLAGFRSAGLPATTNHVTKLLVDNAGISLSSAHLAAQPGLRSVEGRSVRAITCNPLELGVPSGGLSAGVSLLTELVLSGRDKKGPVLPTGSLPSLRFRGLPSSLRVLKLFNIDLVDEDSSEGFRLMSLDTLHVGYGVVPEKPYSKLLGGELPLNAPMDFLFYIDLTSSGADQPESVRLFVWDLTSLDVLRGHERLVIWWLKTDPFRGQDEGLQRAAAEYKRAYEEQMMPQEAMFMLLNKETAAGRVPALDISWYYIPGVVYLQQLFPGRDVGQVMLNAVPHINQRLWHRHYGVTLQPAFVGAVTTALQPWMAVPFTLQRAQQLLGQVAAVYNALAAPSARYHVQTTCVGNDSGGCRIDLAFAAAGRVQDRAGRAGKPWVLSTQWALTQPEHHPLLTMGVLLRMLPPPDARMRPITYRLECTAVQLMQRTFYIGATTLLALLQHRLGHSMCGGVSALQGVAPAELQVLQRLFEVSAAEQHQVMLMPDLEVEESRGQSSHLASLMRMARFMGERFPGGHPPAAAIRQD